MIFQEANYKFYDLYIFLRTTNSSMEMYSCNVMQIIVFLELCLVRLPVSKITYAFYKFVGIASYI